MNPTIGTASVMHLQPDPYSALIKQFVNMEFPTKCLEGDDLVTVLVEEILATRNIRYGPKPSAEVQVAIKQVIEQKVANKLPIPFMVPWGSEKPDSSMVDLAELMALKQIKLLNNRVLGHYEPGIVANIRLEDASAPYLFDERAQESWEDAKRYVKQMTALKYVLNLPYVNLVPESLLVDPVDFGRMADRILKQMFDYLWAMFNKQETSLYLLQLQTFGWKGAIAQATFDFYMHQYSKMYPGTTFEQRVMTMAHYFASAWARYKLNIRGDEPEWNKEFIDLSFIPAVPGTEKFFGRRVQYRTLSAEFTNLHGAPWRSKGYLEIDNENNVIPKITTFNDKSLRFHEHSIELSRGDVSTYIKADYVLT